MLLSPHRSRPQYRPQVEELEKREVLSGYEPTPSEQLLLEQLNDIRANPGAYGATIGLDLAGVAAAQPLALNLNLMASARGHAEDMNARGYFSHVTLGTSRRGGDRMVSAGFQPRYWAESIAAGYGSVESALRGLIIDSGVPDLGHRRHLLAIDDFFKPLNQVGVGVVTGGNAPYYNYFVIDNAVNYDSRSYLTGVVINDLDRDGKYDIGEGLGQVNIAVQGVGTFTSWSSGGYSVPLNPGTYTVTFSGGGLVTPVTRTFTIGSSNVRLTLIAPTASSTPVTPPQSTPSGSTTTPPEPTPTPEPTPPPATSTPATRWLQELGQRLLRRDLTSAELTPWTTHLQNGGSTDAVVQALTATAEYKKLLDTDWVQATGKRILQRDLTAGELSTLVAQLQSTGKRESVVGSLMTLAGKNALSNEAWVTALGQALLNRTLASYEVRYWSSLLPLLGKTTLAIAMMSTTEYVRLDATRVASQLGQSILKRPLTAAEASTYAAQLQSGTTMSALALTLVNLADFTQTYRQGG